MQPKQITAQLKPTVQPIKPGVEGKKAQQKPLLISLLIVSILSPVLILVTLISGILGLASDTAHVPPNIFQKGMGVIFVLAFYGALTIGPVLSLIAIVISAINLKVFSRKLTVTTIVLLSILLLLPVLAWVCGLLSLPDSY